MSIIIENMEMPENCLYCPIKNWEEEWFKKIYYRCPLINRAMKLTEREAKKGRLEDCPLKELKGENND